MEIGLVLAIVGAIFLTIVILGIIISSAGASGNFNGIVEGFTLIANNLTELCTKIADWWNGIYTWFVDSWEAIVNFFEMIAGFFS